MHTDLMIGIGLAGEMPPGPDRIVERHDAGIGPVRALEPPLHEVVLRLQHQLPFPRRHVLSGGQLLEEQIILGQAAVPELR